MTAPKIGLISPIFLLMEVDAFSTSILDFNSRRQLMPAPTRKSAPKNN
jgi:hypothetical protein